MAFKPRRWLDRVARERAGDRWSQLAQQAHDLGQGQLADLGAEAKDLRHSLNRVILAADRRAAASRAGLVSLRLPVGTDWRWRPDVLSGPASPNGVARPGNGQSVGATTTVWHDCPNNALSLTQRANRRTTDLSPFALEVEVFGFAGSYLSLSLDLPVSALDGLTNAHVIRVETLISTEQPVDIYTRLNVTHGPNTEELLRHLADGTQQVVTEFDLAVLDMNEQRLEKIWLDIIIEKPWMNAIRISDLFVSRHMRADI